MSSLRHIQEEMTLEAVDPNTGQPYEFWAEGVWTVYYSVDKPSPRTYYDPGDPGGINLEEEELISCRAWIDPQYVQAGAVQIGLDQVIDDPGDGNLIEIKPTEEQIQIIANAYDPNSVDTSNVQSYDDESAQLRGDMEYDRWKDEGRF